MNDIILSRLEDGGTQAQRRTRAANQPLEIIMIRNALLALGILLTGTASAEWTLESRTDDFTDETRYWAQSENIFEEPYGAATLLVPCIHLETDVVGLLVSDLNNVNLVLNSETLRARGIRKAGEIDARIDNNPIFTTIAIADERGITLIDFLTHMRTSRERIRIQVPYPNGKVTLEFNAAGMEEALQQLEAACTG